MEKKYFTLEELARRTSSRLQGDPHYQIWGAQTLSEASSEEISFLANPRYYQQMLRSKAGAVVLSEGVDTPDRNALVAENPSRTFQEILELFRAFAHESTGFSGIHPTAVVHPTAVLAADVAIGPYAVIDAHVHIAAGTTISSHCYVGPHTTIGEQCFLHPHVTLREGCQLGNRVIIQPGAVIGSCGYGYTTDSSGVHTKLNQIGNVVIEDDVEIGANSTIDRARIKSTRIGQGTKIDNLVQIAHGVVIGKHNLIVAQTGIAGSSSTGDHVILAGKVAVNGHISICSHTIVAACAAVSKSITKPGKYCGIPAVPLHEHHKNYVILKNIDKYIKKGLVG